MTLSYNQIGTKEQLKTRVKDGQLSVGRYFVKIRHLLSETQTDENSTKVKVKYSSTYGTTIKDFYI